MRLRTTIVVAVAGALVWVATGCGAKPAAQGPGRLVYDVSNERGARYAGLFLVDADGGHRTRLTRAAPPAAIDARWSPGGHKILFATQTAVGGEIWTINPDGSGA